MLFRKKKKASEKKRIGKEDTQCSSSKDMAKDTVAALLRILGEYALPTSSVPADEYGAECERLAKEVLIQAGADGPGRSASYEKRTYAEIKQRVRAQRKAESSEYNTHRESANIIVADLVAKLRRSLEERQGQDSEIIQMLTEMEAAVETRDLTNIRRVCSQTAIHIKHVISVQRERDKEQLESLSSQLRSMRQELKEAQSQMQRDPLTELHNRGAFDDAFEKTVEISQASAMDLTLFMLDLDYFKKVNDAYGHDAGDFVLKAVSKQLIRCFPRRDDMVVRFGGEEFAIICRNTGIEDAYMLGERVRRTISELPIELDEITYHQTASVGYAVLEQGESPRDFFKRADSALYQAKSNGRNRVEPQPSE